MHYHVYNIKSWKFKLNRIYHIENVFNSYKKLRYMHLAIKHNEKLFINKNDK